MEKKLREFFSLHFEYLELLTAGYPCHNPCQVEAWEGLFLHTFGELPTDESVCEQYPLYRRPGSTDPRWDSLIHTMGYGKAMSQFLQRYMEGAIIIVPPKKEAA